MFIIFLDKIVFDLIDDFFIELSRNNKDTEKLITDFSRNLETYTKGYKELDPTELENMGKIIGFYLSVYAYLYLLVKDKVKPGNIKSDNLGEINSLYQTVTDLINLYQNKKVEAEDSLTIWNSLNDKERQLIFDKSHKAYPHNLIKLIVIKKLHQKQRRHKLFEILKPTVKETSSVDILVSKKSYLDFASVESMLQAGEKLDYQEVNEVYKFLKKYSTLQVQDERSELSKIRVLFESGIIVPITHDFLRYHRNDYFFARGFTKSAEKTRKINVAVDINNQVKQLYNPKLDPVIKEKTNNLIRDLARNSIYTNVTEEVRIITRIINDHKNKKIITEEYYEEFISIKDDKFQNFNEFPDGFGIYLKLKKSILALRYSNIIALKTEDFENLNLRTYQLDTSLGIVGVCVPHRSLYNLKTSDLKLAENTDELKDNLLNKLEGKESDKSMYWIFDKQIMDNEDISKEEIESNIIEKLADLYDFVFGYMIDRLNKFVIDNQNLLFFDYRNEIKKIEDGIFRLDYNNTKYHQLDRKIYYHGVIKTDDIYDENENRQIDLTNAKDLEVKPRTIYNLATCQHFLTWEKIKKMDKLSPLYDTMIFNYIKQFATQDIAGENTLAYVCRSCQSILNIKNYIIGGQFDKSGNYITSYSSLYTSLSDLPRYKEYEEVIDFTERRIEKIAELLDITAYLGYGRKSDREKKVREVIDLILFFNSKIKYYQMMYQDEYNIIDRELKLKLKQGTYQKDAVIKSFRIQKKDLDDKYIKALFKRYNAESSVFGIVDLSKVDAFSNLIISYAIVVLILELNETDIGYLKQYNKFNYKTFLKYKSQIFDRLRIGKKNISDYNVLAFILYLFSGILLEFKVWDDKVTLDNQIIIIDTVVDILNHIVETDDTNLIELLKHLQYDEEYQLYLKRIFEVNNIKFSHKINNFYADRVIIKKLTKNAINLLSQSQGTIQTDQKYLTSEELLPDVLLKRDKFNYYFNYYKRYRSALFWIPDYYVILDYPYKVLDLRVICQDTGLFHQWEVKGTKFICQLCNKEYSYVKTLKWTKEYTEKYNKVYSDKIFGTYKTREFNQIVKRLIEGRNNEQELDVKINKEIEDNNNQQKSIVKKYQTELETKKRFLIDFVEFLDFNLNKESKLNINIYENVYRLDYNYNGIKLTKSIVIEEKYIQESKEQLFKFGVVFFIKNEVTYFFSKASLQYLGYRKKGKKIMMYEGKKNIIYLNYIKSVKRKLQYLGLPDELDLEELELIGKDRNQKIKSFIRSFHIYLWNFKYEDLPSSSRRFEESTQPLLKKYKFDLSMLKINKDFLDKIEILNDYIFFDINQIKAEKISAFSIQDKNNNLLLYYFILEFNKLIKNNADKTGTICQFFYDFLEEFTTQPENNYSLSDKIIDYVSGDIDSIQIYADVIRDLDPNEDTHLVEREELDEDETEARKEEGYDLFDNDNDPDDVAYGSMD